MTMTGRTYEMKTQQQKRLEAHNESNMKVILHVLKLGIVSILPMHSLSLLGIGTEAGKYFFFSELFLFFCHFIFF